MKAPAQRLPRAEPNKAAPSLAPVHVHWARAVVMDRKYDERVHKTLAERALEPVQTKPAVDTGYGDLIAMAQTAASRRPDAMVMPVPVRGKQSPADRAMVGVSRQSRTDDAAICRGAERGKIASGDRIVSDGDADCGFGAEEERTAMTREFERTPGRASVVDPAPVTARPSPGKTTLVQLHATAERSGAGAASPKATHDIAARGIAGTGSALPHLDRIQAAFGRHDIRGIAAHAGPEAAHASSALGAEAYATGNNVAFATASPSPHTAAHEAAHVVQQRAGVQLRGGVGEAGDHYEQHADAVADAVVAGGSAEGLLDQIAGGAARSSGSAAVQREEPKTPAPGAGDPTAVPADPDQDILDKGDKAIANGKTKFHWYPEQSTDGRAREFIFADADADKLLDHLINKWDGSPEARLEAPSANSGVPLWVSKFRLRALSVRTTPVGGKAKSLTKLPEASEKQIRQATAAGKLADAIAPKTAAEQFREDLVHQADKTIGKVIITSAGLAKIRHPTDPTKTAMPGYTSCIDTASNETNSTKVDKGAARPTLSGIGTLQVQSSPAFTRFTPGSADRPRVGDFAIYAKDKGSGPAFQHIDVIRRMDPPGPDGLETWYTIDGGQESTASDTEAPTAERTGKFNPATGGYGDRMLFGWVDVERLYNEAQKAKKP